MIIRAAQASLEWFEGLGRYVDQERTQFAFNLLTRSRRVTYDNLALRDPGFVAAMTYFSISALTSASFGDIFPVHPFARCLANLEAMIGQLYPATLLARVVTLEFAHRRGRNRHPDVQPGRSGAPSGSTAGDGSWTPRPRELDPPENARKAVREAAL